MKFRKLTWADVEAIRTIADRGIRRTRVHAHLKGCPFVDAAVWWDKPDFESPELQKALLGILEKNLREFGNDLRAYLA